jgi:hypothetical protein
MDAVRFTHDIVPIPAFASLYDRYLKGAVVEVHFALSSWVFAGKKPKAMNIPVIHEILVIVPSKACSRVSYEKEEYKRWPFY